MTHDEDEDLDLPEEPETKAVALWRGDSPAPATELSTESVALDIEEDDIKDIALQPAEKKVFLAEMKSCDIYLDNLHACFKHATTVSSVIALVGASIGVHKHRRSVMEKVSLPKPPTTAEAALEFDNMGNLIKKVS